MKKLLSLVLLFALTLSLTGCSLFYESADELYYGFDIGYSEFYNEAFVAAYHWDGTDGARITIPEEYNDIPVTSFGGYIGRGFPMPTMIHFKDDIKLKNTLCPSATEWFGASDAEIIWQLENCCFITYNFSLHVSKNIEKITDLSLDYFDVAKTVEEDITYHTYSYICSPSPAMRKISIFIQRTVSSISGKMAMSCRVSPTTTSTLILLFPYKGLGRDLNQS
ncbi:MAG: hypothetical protein IJF38_07530 [Clostridia bacterium]|nr:hypothetical protein [Clostridia bacterium]